MDNQNENLDDKVISQTTSNECHKSRRICDGKPYLFRVGLGNIKGEKNRDIVVSYKKNVVSRRGVEE